MSCHYSCASCSASTYFYKCTSCPVTRQLIGSTCFCLNDYYEKQQSACSISSDQFWITEYFVPFADSLYYINISLFWIYVLMLLSRINNPFLRVVINFAQIGSLINYLPYVHHQITHRLFRSIGVYNFQYLFGLAACTPQGMPTVCNQFENLVGYSIVFGLFSAAFYLSYLISSLLYQKKLTEPLTLQKYFFSSIFMFLFNFLDITSVYISVSIGRILYSSNMAFIILFFVLIVYGIAIKKYFSLINTKSQAYLIYRSLYSWIYIYDTLYHLYYIDFLFQAKPIQQNQQQADLEEEADQIGFSVKSNMTKAFFPHSNLVIIEILFKICFGLSVVLLFQYQPSLLAFPLLILMIILPCWIRAFFAYQKLLFWCYLLFALFTLLAYALFWGSFFWIFAIIYALTFPTIFISSIAFTILTDPLMTVQTVNQLFGSQQNQFIVGQKKKLSHIKPQQKKTEKQEKNYLQSEEEGSEDDLKFHPIHDVNHDYHKKQLQQYADKRRKSTRKTQTQIIKSQKSLKYQKQSKQQKQSVQRSQSTINQFATIKPSNYQQKRKQQLQTLLNRKQNSKKSSSRKNMEEDKWVISQSSNSFENKSLANDKNEYSRKNEGNEKHHFTLNNEEIKEVDEEQNMKSEAKKSNKRISIFEKDEDIDDKSEESNKNKFKQTKKSSRKENSNKSISKQNEERSKKQDKQ